MQTTEKMVDVAEKFAAAWGDTTHGTSLTFDVNGVDMLNTLSLKWHYEYQRDEGWFDRMGEAVLCAGIFLGEVIRRLHGSAAVLAWETHEEALAREPQLINVLGPKSLGNAALLTPSDRQGYFFPIGKVVQRVTAGSEHDLRGHAAVCVDQLRSAYGLARP
jgi:hypothetical protein